MSLHPAEHALVSPPSPSLEPFSPLRPSVVFRDKRLVVVGGTGFLGKVWIAMLLERFPELEHMYLLVRPKKDQSPDERFWAQIVTSPVFDPLRERYPGEAFEAFIRRKITPIAGDIVEGLLGISPAVLAEMKGRVHAVVNVAGVVDFNPPLDEALDVNAFGVNNLVALARHLDVPVMHTSTCYVAGYRAGHIDERDPRETPFPRAEGETWYGAAFNAESANRYSTGAFSIAGTKKLDRSHWDPQREIDECLDLIKTARHRCEDSFRQSLFLDQAKANLEARGEPTRGTPLDDELAKVKRKFVEERLIEAGQERALYWGWTNIYTYTKSIGEQVLAASGVPFTIVRPAVVESSVEFPFPGWNEGINTSAPYLYMAMKGQVQLPGAKDVCLDIIPVDMVCAGMIASLAELLEGKHQPVYQYGSTDTNGCRMPRYLEIAGLYKRRQVWEGKKSKLWDHLSSRFEPRGISRKQYETHGAHALASALRTTGKWLDRATMGPWKGILRPVADTFKTAATTEDKLGDVIDLFLPFTSENDWVFSCANTRAAMARMPPEERARFVWWPEKIDWYWWMTECHMPGLEKWVFPEIEDRRRREVKPLRPYDTLVDVLDEIAQRYEHGLALQELTSEGLTRLTFDEWRDASLRVAAQLAVLGVRKGDRVIVSGKNHPAWPIAYFGVLRAGAIAVPVDPELDGPRFANVAKSSGAVVGLWDAGVEERAGDAVRHALVGVQTFDLQRFAEGDVDVLPAPPGGEPLSREALAALCPSRESLALGPDDLASIIYTSGTTGEPKGVMLSHGNFASLVAALAPIFPLGPDDRVLSVLPLHHTFEFTCGMLLPLSRGARIIYLPERNAESLGEGLKKGRVTAMVGVPALWQMLERRITSEVKDHGPMAARAFDMGLELSRMLGRQTGLNVGRLLFGVLHARLGGNIRYLISGGAALPRDTSEVFRGLGLPLSEGYGLTEAAPVLSVAKASPGTKPGHVGKAIPGVEIKIASPDASGVGEVLARGPNVMKGYANDDLGTQMVLDDEGWLHTGDLGKLDKQGRLVLVGRQKDVIVASNGENVYPDDVEELLGVVPGIKELSIVGVPDHKGGERVACLAVPEADDDVDEPVPSARTGAQARKARTERARAALREAFEKLPKHCQPAVVHLWDAELPRTPTRKVKRAEVKKILDRLVTITSVPPPGGAEARAGSAVRRAVASVAGKAEAELRAETSLKGDLGFDSLMAMELHAALEAGLGRSLDAGELVRLDTVGELEAHLEASAHEGAVGRPRFGAEADEADERAPIRLPKTVTDPVKRVMTKFQLGFYDKVMEPEITGRAFLPHNRNTIVVSNHASHLDMGFVKYALGEYGDGIVSLAAQDYFFDRDRWRRAYFENLTNLAPFDRKGGLRAALRQAEDILEQGKTILIFPEGTRSPDGAIQEFKPVIGHLALGVKVDILPVWIGGTYEAMPKGARVPTKRRLRARIGPPLAVRELERLTAGMKPVAAYRRVAELARLAVCELRDGRVLDLSTLAVEEAAAELTLPAREHPLVALFRYLEGRFDAARVERPITFYFTLGSEPEAKWTLRIAPDGTCQASIGKPDGQADCVLKTSADIFTKIVKEQYTPSPMEFLTGAIKSNDIALLQTFQKAFDLA